MRVPVCLHGINDGVKRWHLVNATIKIDPRRRILTHQFCLLCVHITYSWPRWYVCGLGSRHDGAIDPRARPHPFHTVHGSTVKIFLSHARETGRDLRVRGSSPYLTFGCKWTVNSSKSRSNSARWLCGRAGLPTCLSCLHFKQARYDRSKHKGADESRPLALFTCEIPHTRLLTLGWRQTQRRLPPWARVGAPSASRRRSRRRRSPQPAAPAPVAPPPVAAARAWRKPRTPAKKRPRRPPGPVRGARPAPSAAAMTALRPRRRLTSRRAVRSRVETRRARVNVSVCVCVCV